MNIDELTLKQIKEIAAIAADFSNSSHQNDKNFTPHIGKMCIIRAYASGVFFAEVVKQSGRMVELKNSRRLWNWKAKKGVSVSAVALYGVEGNENKFSPTVSEQTILDALEIIPASDDCIKSINGIKDHNS